MQIEVLVGVFLLSGPVLDGIFGLHSGFVHIFKTAGLEGGIWRLIEYCIFGMVRGVLYNRRLFGSISAYRI